MNNWPSPPTENPFQVGKSYQVHRFSDRHPMKIHVLSIVDGNQVVYKFFGRHKQWWHYGIEHFEQIFYWQIQCQRDKEKNKP